MGEPFSSNTPIGYINKAEAYRVGAQVLARELRGVGGWAGDPIRYLYYHCIELYMKAALISAGWTEPQLLSLRHGFLKLAKECNAIGLGLTEQNDLCVLKLIDSQNNYIKARYHYKGPFKVATVQALDCTAHEVAVLAVQMVRSLGVQVREPRPALPFENRFQIG